MKDDKETPKLDRSILPEIYRVQWADIHHNRNQDWELVKVILAGILGLSGISAFSNSSQLIIYLSFSFIFICFIGAFVTYHHKNLFKEKMNDSTARSCSLTNKNWTEGKFWASSSDEDSR